MKSLYRKTKESLITKILSKAKVSGNEDYAKRLSKMSLPNVMLIWELVFYTDKKT